MLIYDLFNINHACYFEALFLAHLFFPYFRSNLHKFQNYIQCHHTHCFLKLLYWFHKGHICKLSFMKSTVSSDARLGIYLFSKEVFYIIHKIKNCCILGRWRGKVFSLDIMCNLNCTFLQKIQWKIQVDVLLSIEIHFSFSSKRVLIQAHKNKFYNDRWIATTKGSPIYTSLHHKGIQIICLVPEESQHWKEKSSA